MTNLKKFFTEITKEQWYSETAEIEMAFDVIRDELTNIPEYREQIRKDYENEIEIINSSVLPLNVVENITKAIENIHLENPMFENFFEWIVWKENTLKLMMKGIRFKNKKLIKLPWPLGTCVPNREGNVLPYLLSQFRSSPTGNSTQNYIIWYYDGKHQATTGFHPKIGFLYSKDDDYYWAYIRFPEEYRWFKCDDMRGFLKLIEWYIEQIKQICDTKSSK